MDLLDSMWVGYEWFPGTQDHDEVVMKHVDSVSWADEEFPCGEEHDGGLMDELDFV